MESKQTALKGGALVELIFLFAALFWVFWAGVWMSQLRRDQLVLADAADVLVRLASLREIETQQAIGEASGLLEKNGLAPRVQSLSVERFLKTPASRFYQLLEGKIAVQIEPGPGGFSSGAVLQESFVVQGEQ